MTSSGSLTDEVLSVGDWVDLEPLGLLPLAGQGESTPASVTQQMIVEDYLHLLIEAQESIQSSVTGSYKGSPRSSPRSPPNSPVNLGAALGFYFTGTEAKEDPVTQSFSSRPDNIQRKPWGFRTSEEYDKQQVHYAKVGSTPLFSKRGLCILVLTNIVSILIGTGVGVYLTRHGYFPTPAIKLA